MKKCLCIRTIQRHLLVIKTDYASLSLRPVNLFVYDSLNVIFSTIFSLPTNITIVFARVIAV